LQSLKLIAMDLELLIGIAALNIVAWIVCDVIEQAGTKHS